MEENEQSNNVLASILGKAEDAEVALRKRSPVSKSDSDYEYIRENLKHLIDRGTDAFEELMDVATSSGHPRAFEALTMLMRELVQANKEMMETKLTNQKIENEVNGQPQTVNQNLYVTTATLAKMLEQAKNEKTPTDS